MITVLIDHNIEGQAALLWTTIESTGWAEAMKISFARFAEIGLPDDSSDRAIWRFAQTQRMFLLTGNRNKRGDDSLEQTIRDENSATALPVITVGDADRLVERAYREDCADRLLEIVLYTENYLGTGRQYIP
ncbi:MAG: ACP S-malonyltransferase [Blastocatellia bacterium]